MSVEEARQRLWNALMDFEDSFADDLDRLILEVQAEMPCRDSSNPDCPSCSEPGCTMHLCPSCTARMKLKETADAR